VSSGFEAYKEPFWREWAPNTGAYMNEGNPFSSAWKLDLYGDNCDRLLEIKRKHDPIESLYTWSGLDSDVWHYDLRSGLPIFQPDSSSISGSLILGLTISVINGF
jgi:hypothetical protein